MTRQEREEAKALSLELLGTSSKWKKLTTKPQYLPVKDAANGAKVSRASYLTEEQVLELLRTAKAKKNEKKKIQEVQELAGSIG